MREALAREHPDAVVSHQQRGAARVPRVRADHDHPGRRRRQAARSPRYVASIATRLAELAGDAPAPPFAVMKSNGGVASAPGGGPAAHHDRAQRACRGRARRRPARPHRRVRQGAHPGRRRNQHRRVRRARRRAHPDDGGLGRRLPEPDPDDRRRHGGRRRRLGRLDLPRGRAQGGPALGRRRPGPALLRQGRHGADRHRRARRPGPHPPAPARRPDPARRRRRPRGPARPRPGSWAWGSRSAPGASSRSAPGTRRTRCGRSASSAGSTSATSRSRRSGGRARCSRAGWSTSSGWRARSCRPSRATSRRSGCSRSTSAPTTCAPTCSRTTRLDLDRVGRRVRARSRARPARRWPPRGSRTGAARAQRRPAVRGPGLRGAGAGAGRVRWTPPCAAQVADAFHSAHQALYGYAFPPRSGRDDQRVEWVNLRVTGVGPIRRPDLPTHEAGDGDPARALTGRRRVVFEEPLDDVPVYWRPDLRPGRRAPGPGR